MRRRQRIRAKRTTNASNEKVKLADPKTELS